MCALTDASGVEQAMRDIVAKCLVKDLAKRPTAAQLLEHKFFKARASATGALTA